MKTSKVINTCNAFKSQLDCVETEAEVQKGKLQVKSQGCPESVNSVKSKASASVFPAAKIKKPRRAEANFYPSFPLGETQEGMEKET